MYCPILGLEVPHTLYIDHSAVGAPAGGGDLFLFSPFDPEGRVPDGVAGGLWTRTCAAAGGTRLCGPNETVGLGIFGGHSEYSFGLDTTDSGPAYTFSAQGGTGHVRYLAADHWQIDWRDGDHIGTPDWVTDIRLLPEVKATPSGMEIRTLAGHAARSTRIEPGPTAATAKPSGLHTISGYGEFPPSGNRSKLIYWYDDDQYANGAVQIWPYGPNIQRFVAISDNVGVIYWYGEACWPEPNPIDDYVGTGEPDADPWTSMYYYSWDSEWGPMQCTEGLLTVVVEFDYSTTSQPTITQWGPVVPMANYYWANGVGDVTRSDNGILLMTGDIYYHPDEAHLYDDHVWARAARFNPDTFALEMGPAEVIIIDDYVYSGGWYMNGDPGGAAFISDDVALVTWYGWRQPAGS